MRKKNYTTQIYDGRTYSVLTPRKMKVICCDCGLVHDVHLKVKNRELIVKVCRNERNTAQRRRHKNSDLFLNKKKWKLVRNKGKTK